MKERPHEERGQPIVPFVAFGCPDCGRHKPYTHKVRGRLRFHVCKACGCKYRSLQMPPTSVHGFERGPQRGPTEVDADGAE